MTDKKTEEKVSEEENVSEEGIAVTSPNETAEKKI